VIVASSLLIVAMVPILKGLTSVHLTASLVEQRTESLNHAQTILESIKASSIYDFNGNYSKTNQDLGDSYLCTSRAAVVSGDLQRITVTVGYDKNGNGNLQVPEVLCYSRHPPCQTVVTLSDAHTEVDFFFHFRFHGPIRIDSCCFGTE